jgi:hypothetical protein
VYRVNFGDPYEAPRTTRLALSRRQNAQQFRMEVDHILGSGAFVEFDFEGVDATQSFMDELIGMLVLERGATVLSRLRFKGCTDDMKGIIKFVVNDRAAQFLKSPRKLKP